MIDWVRLHTIAEVLQAFATVGAIIIGGVWTYFLFIQKRQKYPRAALRHSVLQKKLPKGKKLFHVILFVDNAGDTLIKLVLGEVRLLQVLPLENDLKKNTVKSIDLVTEKMTEIDWPQLYLRKINFNKETCEIEPGESEEFHFDFVLDRDIKTIMLYSYLRNEIKPKKDIGWSCTSMHDID